MTRYCTSITQLLHNQINVSAWAISICFENACFFRNKRSVSLSSLHLVSRLGKAIKWNGSKIFLNNLIGWTNTEVSSEWDATVRHVTKTTHAEARISWTSISDVVAYWPSFFSVRSTIVSYRRRGQSSSALQRHMTSEYILMCVNT